MQEGSNKLLITWWATHGLIGVLVLLVAVYPLFGARAERAAAAGVAPSAAPASAPAVAAPAAPATPVQAVTISLSLPPHEVRDATAPPYNPDLEVDLVFTMDDRRVIEIAPDTPYVAWTYNGMVPGPVIRVRQGAKLNITLINEGLLPHSLDFHSARTPIANYRNVAPGESFTWSFVAAVPGAYLYHCGTAPALQHIGNGMYGVMIVDPDPPLPPADREYVLLQSEFYFGPRDANGAITGDFAKMQKIEPDIVAFNGHQTQYRDQPLWAEPGELVRFWVVDAGPTMNSAFHVVGEIFDRVYANGNPAPENLDVGVQTALVPVGGGAMFEIRPKQAGDYLVVSHAFAQANRGAVGVLRVGEPADVRDLNIDH